MSFMVIRAGGRTAPEKVVGDYPTRTLADRACADWNEQMRGYEREGRVQKDDARYCFVQWSGEFPSDSPDYTSPLVRKFSGRKPHPNATSRPSENRLAAADRRASAARAFTPPRGMTLDTSGPARIDADKLRARIEAKLGWQPGESSSMSLPSLRELIRPVSQKLFYELNHLIESGEIVRGERYRSRRRSR